jgi:hypothetical protein
MFKYYVRQCSLWEGGKVKFPLKLFQCALGDSEGENCIKCEAAEHFCEMK